MYKLIEEVVGWIKKILCIIVREYGIRSVCIIILVRLYLWFLIEKGG